MCGSHNRAKETDLSGERNLKRLLASMQPELSPGVFVFVTTDRPVSDIPAEAVLMSFREREGLTLILVQDAAARAGLSGVFPCRMITLNVHSSLDAVGFLAAITTRLATAGMGVNPVSAFFHDHLFVPAERADEAMSILLRLSEEHGQ